MSILNLFQLRGFGGWLGALLLCAGCEIEPSVYFEPYTVQHPLDLTRVLGQEVRLVSSQDTIQLRIRYDPATHLNLLTHATTGDTLQQVWVNRHQRLYYFTWPISDNCYWVHAVRIRRGAVQGLPDAGRQINQLEQAVRAGHFPALLQYQDSASGILRLRFDPKALRNFYLAALDSLPVYRLAAPGPATPAASAVAACSSALPAPLLQSMYPNPAADIVQLRLASESRCAVVVFDRMGKAVLTTTAVSTSGINVASLPPGRYVLRVREPGTHRTASRQLVVAR